MKIPLVASEDKLPAMHLIVLRAGRPDVLAEIPPIHPDRQLCQTVVDVQVFASHGRYPRRRADLYDVAVGSRSRLTNYRSDLPTPRKSPALSTHN